MKRAVFLVFILLFSFSYGSVLTELQKKLSSISSIEASFKQRTYMEDLEQPEEFEGRLFITKPATIKIIYEKPIKQIYFLQDNQLIIYTPEEKQAIKSQLSDQFFLLKLFRAFATEKGLEKLFNVIHEEQKGDFIDVVLNVKGKSKIKKVEMLIKKPLEIEQIFVWDEEGNRMELVFYDLRYKKEPIKLYINIPEDVEIIEY
ncbi:LolA family protein [Persephonella sp.]